MSPIPACLHNCMRVHHTHLLRLIVCKRSRQDCLPSTAMPALKGSRASILGLQTAHEEK